jgi:hypothetical protein
MLIPGRRSQGLILTCVIGVAGALGGGWVATSLFHVHSLNGFFNLSNWLTAIAGGGRPAARLSPGQRAVRRFPPVRAPPSTASKALRQTAQTCRSAEPRRALRPAVRVSQ